MYFNNWNHPSFQAYSNGLNPTGTETSVLWNRIEALSYQVQSLIDLVRRNTFGGYTPNVLPFSAQTQSMVPQSFVRVRESEDFLFADYFLPNLGIGDAEIEVIGNRLYVRTKVAVPQIVAQYIALQNTMGSVNGVKGLECFEITGGRLECAWTIPCSFVASQVEASFKDGWLCICIAKAEVGAKHAVKITHTARRTAQELSA